MPTFKIAGKRTETFTVDVEANNAEEALYLFGLDKDEDGWGDYTCEYEYNLVK